MTDAPIVVAGGALATRLHHALAASGAEALHLAPDADAAARLADRAQGLPITTDRAILGKASLIVDTGEGGLDPADLPPDVPCVVAGYDPDPQAFASWPDPSRWVALQMLWPWPGASVAEILPGDATAPAAREAGDALARRLGLQPVLGVGGQRAIGTRLFAALIQAADVVLIDGSTPWEVDEALVAFGFPLGPYEGEDLIGLDLTRARPPAPGARRVPIADRQRDLGKLGRKTGAGWYRYPGGGGKVDDPIVADLALEEAYFAKITRTDYTQSQIADRLILALIAEAARLVEGGAGPGSIDRVAQGALGFPSDRGGPLAHARDLGPDRVVAALDLLATEAPLWAAPGWLRDWATGQVDDGVSASFPTRR